MFARKGMFSSIGRAGAVATVVAVALTAFQPSMAFAGSATRQGRDGVDRTSDATDFALAAGIIAVAVVALRPQRPSPASSAPVLRSRPPRTAAHYYDDGYYGGGRPITAAGPYYGGQAGYYGGGPYYRGW